MDAVSKLRQIVADITVATANASQRSSQYSIDMESRSCEYDNVTSSSTASLQKVDTSNTDLSASGRFVSNTSVTLSPAALLPAMPGAPPRTRTTMREMQDSDNYVSFTSAKDIPICAPATAVRRRPPTPAEDVEKEWKQIVYAAETVIEGNHSVDEFSDMSSFERLPTCIDSVDSDRQQMIVSAGGDAQSLEPLSFANPLFLYKTSARASSAGSASSLDSSVIQKSYSLSSVSASNDPSTASCRKATTSADRGSSQGNSVLTRQRVSTGAQGWKPSQSNECLTGNALVREHPQMRHSTILSASGPSTKPLSVSSSLSRSTELSRSCDTEHSKRSAAVSNAPGLDTPPESPRAVVNSSRKQTPSQNNVRMGVRSMQRRPLETDKSKIEARPLIYTVLLMLHEIIYGRGCSGLGMRRMISPALSFTNCLQWDSQLAPQDQCNLCPEIK